MRRHLALLLEISCFVQAVNTAVVKQEALSINAVAVNRKLFLHAACLVSTTEKYKSGKGPIPDSMSTRSNTFPIFRFPS